jgi:hypothetical protein
MTLLLFFLFFLSGFLTGGFIGILLMTIFAAGKREDEMMEKMFKKI